MILAGTGHRIRSLTDDPSLTAEAFMVTVRPRLLKLAVAALEKYQPEGVLSGMAIGWDQTLAEAAIQCDIPWQAYVPFDGQERRWPDVLRKHYLDLLDAAGDIHYAAFQPSVSAFFTRNTRMIDAADEVVALWSGRPGGTAHAVEYARAVGKPVHNLWKSWLRGR